VSVTPSNLNQPGFLASFTIGALLVFAMPLFFARKERAFGDRALDGLSGCYPKTGYIGFPLAFLAYGPPSSPGATIAAVLTTCVLFGIAIALLEWDRHRGHAFGATVAKVGKSLFAQPDRDRADPRNAGHDRMIRAAGGRRPGNQIARGIGRTLRARGARVVPRPR
jgi:hypothetical protein